MIMTEDNAFCFLIWSWAHWARRIATRFGKPKGG